MDTEALSVITLLLTISSYFVTFLLGYGVRSYFDSRQRRYD